MIGAMGGGAVKCKTVGLSMHEQKFSKYPLNEDLFMPKLQVF